MITGHRVLFFLAQFLLLASVKLGAVSANEIFVRGRLIDVRDVRVGAEFFPQNKYSAIDQKLASALGDNTCVAVSLEGCRGPEQICCGGTARCRIALDCHGPLPRPWKATGETFEVCGIEYHVFEIKRIQAGAWIDIPYPLDCTHSAVVMGEKITVDGVPEFGTVIAKVPRLRKSCAYNQTITILPDGSYLAACTGTGPTPGTNMYRSSDKGASWELFGTYSTKKNLIGNYHNLFVHNGSVYLFGVGPKRKGLRISRSDDGGRTWTVPRDKHTGLILEGEYHTAPVPILVSGGRVWRACETYPEKHPFVISAPVDANLLDSSSWTKTNTVGKGSTLICEAKMTGELIEGNMVATRDGEVLNLIRANSNATSGFAAVLHVVGVDSLRFNPDSDWVAMPGGGKKFTVRYDAVSDMWWALTNPDFEGEANHPGLGYKVGISHSLMRNRLVLICSRDLINWEEVQTVLYDPDPFFHGFQYADWVFDGEDIAAVVRVAAPESRGLPTRQHDSNMMCFVKIEHFRNLIR